MEPSWDALVEATAGGDLVQTTRWAAARKRIGFRCLHVMVRDAPDRVLLGGCLMYAKRFAPGIWAGFIPRGPLLFTDCREVAHEVVQQVVALAREHDVRFLVVQPPEGGQAVENALERAGLRLGVPSVAPEATLRLDLRHSDEELLARMRNDRRRGIRRALCAGFAVGEEGDVALFHRLYAMTAARRGFTPVSLKNLRAQYEALAPERLCTMIVARHRGVPVAGFWVTRFAGTVTTKLSGWNPCVPNASLANAALEWATIRWARAQGARYYDLGGLDRRYAELAISGGTPPAECRHSPSHFKAGYGGTPVLFPRARFLFTQPWVHLALGSATQRLLVSPRASRIVQRLRNG